GFCEEGKYHPIEVEDNVTAYFEWENKATGVFIASTGEAAGVNRLEISLDDAIIVCEKGQLKIGVLDKPEIEYRTGKGDLFAKPVVNWENIETESSEGAYDKVLEAFAEGKIIADGEEAMNSLYMSNAVYLSSWENRKIKLPERNTEYELEFEKAFENELAKKK
ncbi:MAG: Gfo/Idh/MocA family oxidoreductase, partial [Lachnospira sp.]|nr:Gfo/Idh/MocA family oxidoreductase [Lachnospira sp.]